VCNWRQWRSSSVTGERSTTGGKPRRSWMPEGVTNKLEAWEIKVYTPLTYKKISTYWQVYWDCCFEYWWFLIMIIILGGREWAVPRPLRYVLSLKGKGQSNCADKHGKKERFVVVNKTAPSKNAPWILSHLSW
jgi:hypothetical protein